MPPPQLFFNDASLETQCLGVDQLRNSLRRFIDAANEILILRPGSLMGFETSTLQRILYGQNFSKFLASVSESKEVYRNVLSSIRPLAEAQVFAARGARDIRLGGQPNVGAVLADLCATENRAGWMVSAQGQGEVYDSAVIVGERFDLDDFGVIVGPIEARISNITCREHVAHWRNELHDFGTEISASAKLDEIDGRPIVMYSAPLEHGPPHVHLLMGRNSSATFAKYRFDVFVREKGPPKYDSEMKEWIGQYRDQLMRSWDRCQRRMTPFELER